MSRKKENVATAALPRIPAEWLDQVITGPMTAEAVEDVVCGFKKAVIERALGAEMSHHLGYPLGAAKPGDMRYCTTRCIAKSTRRTSSASFRASRSMRISGSGRPGARR